MRRKHLKCTNPNKCPNVCEWVEAEEKECEDNLLPSPAGLWIVRVNEGTLRQKKNLVVLSIEKLKWMSLLTENRPNTI